MTMVLLAVLAQSLLQDDASPYDPPKKPALKKRDQVLVEFATHFIEARSIQPAAAPAP